MSLQVGDKVVCVDDSPYLDSIIEGSLVKGRVYVLKWVGVTTFYEPPRRPFIATSVRLIGVTRWWRYAQPGDAIIDEPFGAIRFRKLDELKAESRERYYRGHPQVTGTLRLINCKLIAK